MVTKHEYPMNITQDEQRLIRFYRCLSITRRSLVMLDIATAAVEDRLPPDLRYDAFAKLMPKPPEGSPCGDAHDGYSITHWQYRALEATGEPSETLLGVSFWDAEEIIPRMVVALKREAERNGDVWFDTGPDFARQLLSDWRFAVVMACEETFQSAGASRVSNPR
jgi:hypothetical protein